MVYAAVLLPAGTAEAHKGHKHAPPHAGNVDDGASPSVAAAKTGADEPTFAYYFGLFTALVADVPIDLQQETIDRATAIFPHLEAAPGPAGLAAATRAFFERLRSRYPVVRVVWDDAAVRVAGDQRPITVARGLHRYVLVEIENRTDGPLDLTALFEVNANSPSLSTRVPVGAVRSLATKLTACGARDVAKGVATNGVVLRLTPGGDAAKTRTATIPLIIEQPAVIRGKLVDSASGNVWPGRVYVVGSDGVHRHAKAYAAIKTVSEKQLLQFPGKFYKLPFFYSDGAFEIEVPPGEVKITLERGYEHEVVHHRLDAKPGAVHEVTLSSGRIIDMKALGWVSGDTHIHWVKNHWSENEDLGLLRVVQRAEDLRVVNNLTLLHRTPHSAFITPSQALMGPIPGYCDGEYHVQMAEEYRNQEFYGHLCFLNITRLILPISTGKGMAGADTLDYPINRTAILDCRAQGGISTEAHGLGLNWNVPVNVIHGLTDSLDQFTPADYYRFLDCGFRLPLTNGSDHPARLAGSARAYVQVEGDFTYEKWIDGIRKCRTFTTSGPLLFLDVNGVGIGGEVIAERGDQLSIRARVLSRYPVGNFQVISSGGEVVRTVKVEGTEAELSFSIPVEGSRWITARCSPNDNYSAIAGPNVAHTSAVYVTVAGRPVFAPDAARHWAGQMRKHSADIAANGNFANDAQRREAVGYIDAGVRMFEELIERHGEGE